MFIPNHVEMVETHRQCLTEGTLKIPLSIRRLQPCGRKWPNGTGFCEICEICIICVNTYHMWNIYIHTLNEKEPLKGSLVTLVGTLDPSRWFKVSKYWSTVGLKERIASSSPIKLSNVIFLKNAYQFAFAKCWRYSIAVWSYFQLIDFTAPWRWQLRFPCSDCKKVVNGDSPGWLVEKSWVVGFSERGFMLDLFYPYARRLLYFMRVFRSTKMRTRVLSSAPGSWTTQAPWAWDSLELVWTTNLSMVFKVNHNYTDELRSRNEKVTSFLPTYYMELS